MYNEFLLYVRLGSASVDSSFFESTNKGEGIQSLKSDFIKVTNSQFIKTPDAVELIGVKKGIISGNIFKDTYDDAIDLNDSKSIKIENNFISDVLDRGIEVGNENFGSSLNILVKNNIIEKCNEGIVFKEGSMGLVINNTLYNNNIGLSCVELVSGTGGSLVVLENTIFSQSVFQDINIDQASIVETAYLLSDQEVLDGDNNIYGNPLFIDETSGHFMLTKFLPCIDKGNPLREEDVDCTVSDIGALYFHQENNCETNNILSMEVYPTIFNEKITIKYFLNETGRVRLSVYDLNGNEVDILLSENQTKGDYLIDWRGAKTNGMYMLNLILGQQVVFKKVIQQK